MGATLCLAHRGFSGKYPENTLAAFQAAIQVPGCHGFESDVHLSADGEPVIIHDPVLERTTNGKGFVKDHTFAQLRQLDCGSWFGQKFAGQQIMHLDELLALVLENKLVLNLEVKNYEVFYEGIEEVVIRHIRAAGAQNSVFLSSFNNVAMEYCKKLDDGIQTGFLYGYPLVDAAGYIGRCKSEALHPRYTCLTYQPQLVQQAHAIGKKVNTWTVNTEEDMHFCLNLGVDSIITNYPDVLATVMENTQKEDRP
ncbi:glycerophosphodiester phosphodiesterase [Ruminococcaceae bacterium OttesenSCG-928-A16]|nr:glycerophosphodiester phosphodiesterase [Ruminococcaceae bacterium OttesenSCG-928-A16]